MALECTRANRNSVIDSDVSTGDHAVQISVCNINYGDCDGNQANGCETALLSDAANCGGCGTVCPSGATCTAGACVCPVGQTACSGACVDQQSDVANCGACGAACAFANASAVCTAGACGLGACNPLWGNCNGDAVDGCETSLNTSRNCGACRATTDRDSSCVNGVVTCVRGNSLVCADSHCHVITSDANNCGGCDIVCGDATPACYQGQCAMCSDDSWCPAGQACQSGTCPRRRRHAGSPGGLDLRSAPTPGFRRLGGLLDRRRAGEPRTRRWHLPPRPRRDRREGQGRRLLLIGTSSLPRLAPTRAFYARRGYLECGTVPDYYGDGDGKVTFVKRL